MGRGLSNGFGFGFGVGVSNGEEFAWWNAAVRFELIIARLRRPLRPYDGAIVKGSYHGTDDCAVLVGERRCCACQRKDEQSECVVVVVVNVVVDKL